MSYPLTNEEFKAIYSRVPRLCVEVVVKTAEGVVLTLRSIKPYKSQYHIPGGTVGYGETLEEAVLRVAKEELGVEVEIEKLLGPIYYPSEVKQRGWGWSVGIAYSVKIKSGKLRGSNQGKKVGIFSLLPENLIAEQKQFLQNISSFNGRPPLKLKI